VQKKCDVLFEWPLNQLKTIKVHKLSFKLDLKLVILICGGNGMGPHRQKNVLRPQKMDSPYP